MGMSADVKGQDEKTAMVWIEDAVGDITRGFADGMTEQGLHVRLADAAGFRQGDLVSLRICFRREAPIVAARARVLSVDESSEALACTLEWVPPSSGRGAVLTWLAAAA